MKRSFLVSHLIAMVVLLAVLLVLVAPAWWHWYNCQSPIFACEDFTDQLAGHVHWLTK